MANGLAPTALERWRAAPVRFITEVLCDPETNKPFELLPAEVAFFEHAFRTDGNGRLVYPEQLYACPKKSGKTGFAAMHMLTTTLVFGGRFAEAVALANDLEQAQGRVFQAIKRIVEASPHLKREAEITQQRITFPTTGAVFQAIGVDYAGAAGANPVISSFDELWAYTSERSRRLWDEMVPPPTRKVALRLTTTYAGFENESVLLEELYARGLKQPQVGPDLYAGDGLLMFWSHLPVAPWQTEAWLADMRRSLRPNQYLRMVENRFTAGTESFVDMDWFDACVDPAARPVVADKSLPVWVGVDASTKRDSTAIVATTWDAASKRVRLVFHRVFQPTASDPLNFEATIEQTVIDLRHRFALRSVSYDPWQMASVAQRLRSAGVPMREFAQSVPNLTAAGSNLFELIKGGGLVSYPDAAIRQAVAHAVTIETPRGIRIAKEKAAHKIDVVVALAMAALAAVRGGQIDNRVPLCVPFCVSNGPRRFPGSDGPRVGGLYDEPVRDNRSTEARWREWYYSGGGGSWPW